MPHPPLCSSASFRKSRITYPISIALTFLVCCALLFSSLVLAKPTTAGGQGQARCGRPEAGPPAATLPNLDEVRRKRHPRPEAPPHFPSLIRSRRKSLIPRNGRRVGDPLNEGIGNSGERLSPATTRERLAIAGLNDGIGRLRVTQPIQVQHAQPGKRHHSGVFYSSKSLTRYLAPVAPSPITDDDYVQRWFTYAFVRQANTTELGYWDDMLRAAYAHAQSSMVMAARELGKTLFESAEYAARARSDHDYIYDLYKTYLMRGPDSGGWTYWEGLVPVLGRENVRRAFDESGEFIYKVSTVTLTGNASSTVSSLLTARVDLSNQSGNQLMARDAEWGLTLLSLPGRAGLDLGLGLSYSSAAVWTRSGPYIFFDDDNSSLSPGFRLGFPTVQEQFFNAQTGQNAYLLITSAGSRVELRQIGASNIYEAADSSYLQLTDNGSSLLLRSSDGSQMSYTKIENEWRCTQVKDRNGNFISVNYNSLGDLTTVIDTLGRTITFNYDSNANLISITQTWNGQPHTWATFGWGSSTVQPNFSGVALSGIANGQSIPIITMVGLDDSTYYKFAYTTWNSGQVSRITHYASDSNPASDNHERAHVVFNYLASDDSTRLTDTRVAAESWTGINGVPSEVITQFGFDGGSAYWLNSPDGTVYKEFYGTEWQKRLPQQTETWSGGVKQKWTTTTWEQDNTGVNYQTNPRVKETNIYDASNNRRRTKIIYLTPFTLPGGASCTLLSDVYEYAADAVAVMRRTHTDYNLDAAYLNKRIVGLPSAKYVCDGSQGAVPCNDYSGSSLFSKVGLQYDEAGSVQNQGGPTQHDETNYSSGLLQGRANLSSTRRYDVNNLTQYFASSAVYNTSGSVITSTDASGHQSSVSYADAFSDSINHNTFAYPTIVTDADGYSSYVQYNYDFGATSRTQGPPPAAQSQGLIQTMGLIMCRVTPA